jgi:phosphoglucosamine mutase
MARPSFGTDGIRGVANSELTPLLALELGLAVGSAMHELQLVPRAVLGRDTRRSGPMLGAALAAGLCSRGIDVTTLGVVPTPAVSFAVTAFGFGLGGVVSASHNPAPDNGIKFFGPDGAKLTDNFEAAVMRHLDSPGDSPPRIGADVGSLAPDAAPAEAYEKALIASAAGTRFDGWKIVLDAANGAGFAIAPRVLRALGAETHAIGTEPGDGTRINAEGGATKPQVVAQAVTSTGADLGIALDGDADRVVMVDRMGRLVNGDRLMSLWIEAALNGQSKPPKTAVSTVMANLGFERHLAELGVKLHRTRVGDKYVAEGLRETGARIGGEPSGHLIFPVLAPTGDGILAAIQALAALRALGGELADSVDAWPAWPQMMVNVAIAPDRKAGFQDAIALAVDRAEAMIAAEGRLSVRASGTQPMIRVMAEHPEEAVVRAAIETVTSALAATCNGQPGETIDLRYELGD